MCREYKLACLNWFCQLLPCFDGELTLSCLLMKNVYRTGTKQHRGIKSGILQPKNNHLASGAC